MNTDQINRALEDKGWFSQENFLDNKICDLICDTYIDTKNPKFFIDAKIGKGLGKTANQSIRKSSIRWITDWDENSSLSKLHLVFSEIMESSKNYFRLPLKRFESQVALYNKGGFYRTHLDQHPKTRHRQISCTLYLNDCEEGGELILYKKGSQTEDQKMISPKKGTIVLFVSGEIYHEVKEVHDERYSITTWFRNDEIVPFI
jgi:SM-20-related protein